MKPKAYRYIQTYTLGKDLHRNVSEKLNYFTMIKFYTDSGITSKW